MKPTKLSSKAIVATPVPSPETQIADQLTSQYQKAVSGTREILVFGCMMMELPSVLELQNAKTRGGWNAGHGLKGWIEEHCPDINYKTAHSFYTLARGMREALGIPAKTDVHKLLSAAPAALSPKERKIRQELDSAIEGKSMRQLEFDFGVRRPKGKSGAPAGNKNAAGKGRLTDAEETKMLIGSEIGGALQVISKRIDNRTIAMMGLGALNILKSDLADLIRRLEPIIGELAKKPLE